MEALRFACVLYSDFLFNSKLKMKTISSIVQYERKQSSLAKMQVSCPIKTHINIKTYQNSFIGGDFF